MQTVSDLIEKLKALDQALPVLVEGYEGGYTTFSISSKNLFKNPKPYCGEFDDAEWGRSDDSKGPVFSSIVLERGPTS